MLARSISRCSPPRQGDGKSAAELYVGPGVAWCGPPVRSAFAGSGFIRQGRAGRGGAIRARGASASRGDAIQYTIFRRAAAHVQGKAWQRVAAHGCTRWHRADWLDSERTPRTPRPESRGAHRRDGSVPMRIGKADKLLASGRGRLLAAWPAPSVRMALLRAGCDYCEPGLPFPEPGGGGLGPDASHRIARCTHVASVGCGPLEAGPGRTSDERVSGPCPGGSRGHEKRPPSSAPRPGL